MQESSSDEPSGHFGLLVFAVDIQPFQLWARCINFLKSSQWLHGIMYIIANI